MDELCKVATSRIFQTYAKLDYQENAEALNISNLVFSEPFLTMSIIEESEHWFFTIKVKVKENNDFFDILKLYGFTFNPELEQELKKQISPVIREKDLMAAVFNKNIFYIIEQMFCFSKKNELCHYFSNYTQSLDGDCIFLKIEKEQNDNVLYTYMGYHHYDLIVKKYDKFRDYEFCVLYLQQKFLENDKNTVLDEIRHDNIKEFISLLNMVKI